MNLPAMLVDLDLLDYNVRQFVRMAKPHGKTIRLATKSVRCPDLIKRILDKGQGVVKGLMCYSMHEVAFLADKFNMDDFFVPYPTMQYNDLHLALDLTRKGKIVYLSVSCVEDVNVMNERLEELIKKTSLKNFKPVRVSVDLDMSFDFWRIRLGLHRSTCRTVQDFAQVTDAIEKASTLTFAGLMGYEGHVAGLPDANPHASIPNILIRALKGLFFRQNIKFRRQVAEHCLQKDFKINFFNGAGSGNALKAAKEDGVITEITVGSGFLQAQLFDYYSDNTCKGALCFALQATRVHCDYICCQSGGFIASGSCSLDKAPAPYANPLKLVPYPDEGFGEVQTPLQVKGKTNIPGTISLGDPVFFRPAKSGKIAEHFQEYYLKRDYKIVDTAKTYRGHGQVFY